MPAITGTLASRDDLSYFVTYSTPVVTNALSSTDYLLVNGARTAIQPVVLTDHLRGTSYSLTFSASSVNLSYVASMIPGLGIKSSAILIVPPGMQELNFIDRLPNLSG